MKNQEDKKEEKPQKKRKWLKWVIIVILVLLGLSFLSGARQVTVSEAELNAKLAEGLNKPGDNPLLESNIDLREGIGVLYLKWQQGQTLTADIVVSPDGLRLVGQNVNVTGGGILNELFESVSNIALNNVLTTLSVSQRGLQKIEISKDKLVGHYSRRY